MHSLIVLMGTVVRRRRKMIKVGFKKLDENAIIPNKNYPTDSGFDLFANESVIIEPGETKVIKTGIAVQLPPGYEAQVRPRSGVTSKTKLRVQLGTIDNGYTGEIGIITDNTFLPALNKEYFDGIAFGIDGKGLDDMQVHGTYKINKGDKLAQLVIQQLPQIDDYEIDSLEDSTRGSNGFGSSGY